MGKACLPALQSESCQGVEPKVFSFLFLLVSMGYKAFEKKVQLDYCIPYLYNNIRNQGANHIRTERQPRQAKRLVT